MKWKQRETIFDRYISDNMGGYVRSYNVAVIKPRAELTGTKDSFTVQYTGVKDIDGKKIFEGDIVNCKAGLDNWVGFVQFDTASGAFKHYMKNVYAHRVKLSLDINPPLIIGNVFQNPELVEKYKLEVGE